MRRVGAALGAAALLGLVATACTEKLDGSSGCPLTCVDQAVAITTVTLDAVQIDSTVLGGLGLGTEPQMLLANRGDTLDTRVEIRFDTLPSRNRVTASDTGTALSFLDSAYLKLHVDSSAFALGVPVSIAIYDVDDSTATNDTSASVVAPLFTPSRLITTAQFAAGAIVDSISIKLPSDFLLAKAQSKARLRLGLRAFASKSVEFRILSQESGRGPVLFTRVAKDTAVAPVAMGPYSTTPTSNLSVAGSLGDFTLVVKGTPPPPPGILTVGGLPGTRAYILFNIPPAITDSSLVVAATLIVNQLASGSPDPTDSMAIQPYLVLAGPGIADPARAAQITAGATVLGLDPLRTPPGTSGAREIQIGPAFKYWRAQPATLLPRAIVLQSLAEDYSPQQAFFYSSASAAALRPHLRISYTPRSRVGVP